MDCFLYDRDLHHEKINALLLACIHRDIFLDYDKIINIYASKYPRRMLIINPLSENQTVETLNIRVAYKAYIDFIYSNKLIAIYSL